jgi:cholesterol transport system auxiliary component
MRTRMRSIILLITSSVILSTLVACTSINKPKQHIAVYDFGLSVASDNHQQITSKLLVETPTSSESLNQDKIRYRLNYQNPSRVFFYTESRWAGNPSELFSSKLSKIVNVRTTPTNCSLRMRIEAFDQVFHTTTESEGVVQLSAFVVSNQSKKIIASQLMTESVMSVTPNAQGGAAALQQASENALKKAVNWGNMVADNNALCQ